MASAATLPVVISRAPWLFTTMRTGLSRTAALNLTVSTPLLIFAPESKGLDGKLTMTLQCDGMGQSPAGLIGSLHGSGAITLLDGHFAAIDPAAFTAAISAADQSGAIERAENPIRR